MANKSLITDVSRTATTYSVTNYETGVFDHMASDWSAHSQLRIHNQTYNSGAGQVVGTKTLRFVVRDPVTLAQTVLKLPVTALSTDPLAGSAPIINRHPQGGTAFQGTAFEMSVGAVSSRPLTYQWQKYSGETPADIAGQTSYNIVFSAPSASTAGDYRVIVFNSSGSIASNRATVTYSSSPRGGGDSSLFETIIRFTLWPF